MSTPKVSQYYKRQLSVETEKHIIKFLLSPFSTSGWKYYKNHYSLSFPEPSKQITNRIEYLKKLQQTDFVKFALLCDSFGVKSSFSKSQKPAVTFADSSPDSDSDSGYNTYQPPPITKMPPSNLNVSEMRQHEHFLNLDHPHLNLFGMMWFRDNDVEIDDAYYSILTIYQPLFDARDCESVKLYLDANDPTLLHHVHRNVPTFMQKDYKEMHQMDTSKDNPELYQLTSKKHKKAVARLKSNSSMLQLADYQLPFVLSSEKFDNIDNTGSEFQKHYRIIEVDVTKSIKHKCAYIFWKVMIEGETTHFGIDHDDSTDDLYHEAEQRMSAMKVEDDGAGS